VQNRVTVTAGVEQTQVLGTNHYALAAAALMVSVKCLVRDSLSEKSCEENSQFCVRFSLVVDPQG
jgi:hypothetical protein